MRKITIMAAIVLSVVFMLAFSASAFAVSPHTGYGASTDYCIQCHDIHEASGDYVLTRQATVTGVCGTCHGVFGAPAPAGLSWGANPPADMAGTNPTSSVKLAYKVDMTGMSAAQMEAVPGHSLGVMRGGLIVRNLDSIPGSDATLKIMTSGQYPGSPAIPLYGGEAATSKNGTKGLYCASCHTPHGEAGQLIPGSKLLSANPNHDWTNTVTTNDQAFCTACHDKRDNVGVEKNHPDSMCTFCHANETVDDGTGVRIPKPGAASDFPHSSTNTRILQAEPDDLCLICHSAGTLP